MSERITYDSIDKYTSLMDSHVAESRTDNLGLVTGRKRYSCICNEEGEDDILEVHILAPDTLNNSSTDREGTSSNSEQNRSRNYTNEVEEELKYEAANGIKLLVPVSLCMLVVIATISSINSYTTKGHYVIYTPFHEENSDTSTKVWQAIVNSLILMVVIVIMTVLLIILYKYKFYKVINAWLIISSLMLLSVVSIVYCERILKAYNIPMDLFTLGLVSWNFGVVGMICIHWQGPLQLQQAYLIFISALMALNLIKYLPEWTSWVLLGVISIWDLIAVLTSKGPLRILVETAQERNEFIFPAMIYSSSIMYTAMMTYAGHVQTTTTSDTATSENMTYRMRKHADNQNNSISGDTKEAGFMPEWIDTYSDRGAMRTKKMREHPLSLTEKSSRQDNRVGYESRGQVAFTEVQEGVKLGLGDFIFYSILVGKASSDGDWNTTLACSVAILIGLCLTLLLLAVFNKALPALPISITFGVMFYFVTRVIVAPFSDNLASGQVFI
ncbi:Presenilin like protein [Eufriesea mexicana]|uniref:presenilin-1-like n=1 Tax=Eufriesea mexicana TaxID=516756 RepID=UPI00083C407F|nr:PREDICTED: presenilin-1-like [Eufriesea mexicana]OAD60383.1 Presenilin like protein [Eufriesea mexicana]